MPLLPEIEIVVSLSCRLGSTGVRRDGQGFIVKRNCRVELILCLEAARPTLPNLARGVANRANSARWGNSTHATISFVFPDSLHFCRCFPQVALRFRDSRALRLGARSGVSLRDFPPKRTSAISI